VPNVPSSYSLSAQRFFCVETAHPSSLHVSIMWFSYELGPLIWGIGACTLRAQCTSTSAARRLQSLTGESAGVGSNQSRETRVSDLAALGSMETARSAAGRGMLGVQKTQASRGVVFFVAFLALFAYEPLAWHSEPSNLT
jgi:hypothetical protein